MYKIWTIKDIKSVIDEVAGICRYQCDILIEISKRATKRMGAFFYRKTSKGIEPIKFVFSYYLVNGNYSEEVVKEVIIHEYIHYYCDTKMGTTNGHNRIFKTMCRICKISDEATFKYKPLQINDKKLNDKLQKEYYIYCSECNKIVCIHKRKDAVERKVNNYISKCCRAKLFTKL